MNNRRVLNGNPADWVGTIWYFASVIKQYICIYIYIYIYSCNRIFARIIDCTVMMETKTEISQYMYMYIYIYIYKPAGRIGFIAHYTHLIIIILQTECIEH